MEQNNTFEAFNQWPRYFYIVSLLFTLRVCYMMDLGIALL